MKMITKIWTGYISRGKLKLYEEDIFRNWIQSLSDQRIEMTVQKAYKQRSIPENSYYHGVVVKILAEEFGYLPDEMHEAIKYKFLFVPGEKGKPDRIGSTKKLSTVKFEDLMEKIRTWAQTEYNIYIPLPNEVQIEDN